MLTLINIDISSKLEYQHLSYISSKYWHSKDSSKYEDTCQIKHILLQWLHCNIEKVNFTDNCITWNKERVTTMLIRLISFFSNIAILKLSHSWIQWWWNFSISLFLFSVIVSLLNTKTRILIFFWFLFHSI